MAKFESYSINVVLPANVEENKFRKQLASFFPKGSHVELKGTDFTLNSSNKEKYVVKT